MDPCDQDLKDSLSADLETYFPLLVLIYQDKLYRFVLHMLLHQQDAEDIVQDVFIKVYKALVHFTPSELQELKLEAWLFTIAKNLSLNHVKRRGRDLAHTAPLDVQENGLCFEEIIPVQCRTPEEDAASNESREELYRCIKQLSLPLRTSVVLYYFLDFTYDEIAEILNRSVNTVKCNGWRGVQKLKAMMSASAQRKEE